MLNLINRIITLATEKVVSLIDLAAVTDRAARRIEDNIDTDEVREQALQNLVREGIDYNSLAGEISLTDIAGEFSADDIAAEINTDDLVSSLGYDREFIERVGREIQDDDRFLDRVQDAVVERLSDSVETDTDERINLLTARVEALESVEPTATEPTVEVSGALTDHLLTLAVERLLMLADEAVRDGKV